MKIEQLIDHALHAAAAANDSLDDAPGSFILQRARQELGAHHDRTQRISQVVTEDGREQLVAAQHPLQLFDVQRARTLRRPSSRDVAEDEHRTRNGTARVADWCGAVIDRDFAAISAQQHRMVREPHDDAVA